MSHYYKKTNGQLEKALERLEHTMNGKFGTNNVIDIGEKAGFKYSHKNLKIKRD